MAGERARDQAQHQHFDDRGPCLPRPDLLKAACMVRSPSKRNNGCDPQVGSRGKTAEESGVVGGLEADRGDHEVAEKGACPRETCPLSLKSRIPLGRGCPF